MNRPQRRGLRFEIVVSLALLVAAAVGLVGLVVFKYAQREMIALKIETGLLLSRAVEERLRRQPEEDLPALVRTLTQSGFERIVVWDRFRRVRAYTGPWPWPEHPNAADLETALKTRQTQTFFGGPRLLSFGPDPTLALAEPLFDGPRLIGVVGLFSPLTELRAAWARTRWIILAYLAADTLVMVLFGTYLLSRLLVKPLDRMTGRIQALAAGEYHPGQEPAAQENEIGRLEEAFEVMARRLLESRARLEENLAELRATQDSLIRSEKMALVGRLAAGLAHELGNPLGAMTGFVHLLRRPDLTPEERADFLGRLETELGRMDTIIRSLLDFARPAPVKVGPVDLNQVVADALALAAVQKWFQDLKVKEELAADLPPARAEANRLTQVLLNLLTNAGQAVQAGGAVTVRTGRRDEAQVFVCVADTGPGIPAEDLAHIFEPFFTRKAPGQGTGLGLSVSLSIVESFGGEIEVQSEEGRGSVFTVVLPLAGEGEAE